jgi:hypothetical protein
MKPNQSPTSRRAILTQLGAAGALVGIATLGRAAEPTPAPTGSPSYGLSVRDCGAVGDGSTDDTAAFSQALDTVGKAGGGIVFVPTGNYRIQGHLSVPDNVTLEGVFRAPTARSQYRGSTLLAVEGRGQADGEPFVFLHANSVLKGVTIFYPEQDAQKPVPYPWCVRGIGDNCAILDVLLVNPWNAVDFGTFPCGRHLIRGLYGQPLNLGIFVDQCLDVGRIEDVHFWPFWTEALIPFTQKEGIAFQFARTDWELLSGCFCLGYKIGFHFTAVRHDAGNALIVNSGPDVCSVGVQVDWSQVQAGVLFQNCQINAGLIVNEGSLGPVKFMNCGLFGTGYKSPYLVSGDVRATHALLRGQGRTTFIGCHFYQVEGPFVPKDFTDEGHAVIYGDGNGLTVSACDFTGFDRNHVLLGAKSKSTLITGTRFLGGLKLNNAGRGKVETGMNIDE